ncbi:UDP-N-acetylglucosamine 2-epimerase (non-hydrolyzing) [bacterium]|nr:UDP-N-acetylglucosamine 2-epimerase (non-hydrolyzing) [bacterium]
MKTVFVLGTRPEIIKLSPVIRAFERRSLPFAILHTNQHYSPEMDAVFFEQLELPAAQVNLGVGSGSHGEQLGRMLTGIEKALPVLKAETVVVQGDTNSVLAAALIAQRLGLRLAHVEAGLRSRDRRMPEEHNRVLTDHLSDLLFAPTEAARGILLAEGFEATRVHVTGNTVVDAVEQAGRIAARRGDQALEYPAGSYILITLHRPENVDHPETLLSILSGIEATARAHGLEVVFPVHPRTTACLKRFGLSLPAGFKTLGAVDYLRFIGLLRSAALVITDSGGVQEEACILRIPCVTARISTERPETVAAGANCVAGVDAEGIVAAAGRMLGAARNWVNPLGDGQAGERIAGILEP